MRTKTLEQWRNGVRLSHVCHTRSASYNTAMHRALGIPVVIVTTGVGTTVFASLGHSPDMVAVVLTGLFSLLAAILSSLQTFLGYSASAERHKCVAVKYGALRRELDQFLEEDEHTVAESREFMQNFRAKWDAVDQEAPPIPDKIYRSARDRIVPAKDRPAAASSGPAAAPAAEPASHLTTAN